MTPEDLVRALCARHGLPPESGAPYLPLVQKALAAPDDVRDRILILVSGSLAELSKELPGADAARGAADREVLVAIAKVLHGWLPADSILDLGSTFGRSGPLPPSTPT